MICVGLTIVAVRKLPADPFFHSTAEFATKPEPVMVIVRAPEPAAAEAGESELMEGNTETTAPIEKAELLDTEPPGFITPIDADPGAVVKLTGTTAVICVALTKVVERFVVVEPALHCTVEPDRKPEPFRVITIGAEPAGVEIGDREVTAGALMLKTVALDCPAPEFCTVRLAVPGLATSDAGTVAVS